MKKHLSEDTLRGLIRNAEDPLFMLKATLENLAVSDEFHGSVYVKTINALSYLEDIKEQLGYKEPEGTTLKQIKLF